MTYAFQVWNGIAWETRFMPFNPQEVENIRAELEKYGIQAIVVNETLPKAQTSLENNIIKALLDQS